MEGQIVFGFLLVAVLGRTCCCLELKNGAYEDFVVKITEGVPVKDCRIVLDNLEVKKPEKYVALSSLMQRRRKQ
jgi:hypothetical protein